MVILRTKKVCYLQDSKLQNRLKISDYQGAGIGNEKAIYLICLNNKLLEPEIVSFYENHVI